MSIKSYKKNKNQYVVGIGASAGGLEAIQSFFDHIPGKTGLSYIVVQHLSPDYKSLMGELLSKHTDMQIFEAKEGMPVEKDCVYLVPSKSNIIIKDGCLNLVYKERGHGPNMAIDEFFRSLAAEKKDKAIAVILSGTGTDGTKGIKAIKDAGGLVIVQDPLTAKFDGMPNSAIISGYVDFVLPPNEISQQLTEYVSNPFLLPPPIKNQDGVLSQILELLKKETSQDFTLYKKPTIQRRIQRRVALVGLKSMEEYYEYLQENSEELRILGKEFLIGVTKFFRDQDAFEYLTTNVLSDIISKKEDAAVLKVWVAGCSTGEEAYSLAILIHEGMLKLRKNCDVKIFATDIDKDAIDQAAIGMYDKEELEKEVSKERLDKYFVKSGNGSYTINPLIRRMVIFAQHDVTKDAPFSKIDLVTCRNLLIYLNTELQKKVLSSFHYALNYYGYLFLGQSEQVGDMKSHFHEISKKFKVYRNVQDNKKMTFEILASLKTPYIRSAAITQNPRKSLKQISITDQLNSILLEESEHVVIYVDENLDVVQALGDYQKYLQFPEKVLNFNLSRMIKGELGIALGTAIRKAIKSNSKYKIKKIRTGKPDGSPFVDVVVYPLPTERLIVILLSDSHNVEITGTSEELYDREGVSKQQMISLEEELRETKENLQSVIEELETSNEELQSSNEELLSANEELQSTNEELQSLNEELHTVNTEHQLKIKELIELNDDFINYFKSNKIGQILVDNDLIIRKFTPAVTEQINVIEADIGRPISHISNNLRHGNLVNDIRKVLMENTQVERELELDNGKWFLMRILPYLRIDKKVDGVIVTFFDITTLKSLSTQLGTVLDSSRNAICVFKAYRDYDGKVLDYVCEIANKNVVKVLQISSEDIIGRKLLELKPILKDSEILREFKYVTETGNSRQFEYQFIEGDLNIWLDVCVVKLHDGITVTINDITERKRSEEKIAIAYDELKRVEDKLRRYNKQLEQTVAERTKELAISDERFKLITKASNDAVWDWNLVSNEIWLNDNFLKLSQFQNAELKGIELKNSIIHPEDKIHIQKSISEVLDNGTDFWTGEYRVIRRDGGVAYVRDRAYILKDENGVPHRMLGSMVDLTDLKKVQEDLKVSNENLKKINMDLDNFIYTASHDLKAPIANIEGLVDSLREIMTVDDEEINTILRMINTSTVKFKETIKDLTEISKIQKGIDETLEEINIKECLDVVRLHISELITTNNAKFEININDDATITFAKKNFHSILYNLVSNAIKYSCADRLPHVQINVYSKGDSVVLEVKDNGLGIPKEKLSKVFTMFKRFHDHVEGTGVGLYIVKRIVDNAGGKIEVESQEGIGSVFRVYFPKNIKFQKNVNVV
ncbi:MAG: CheR family methyltransferase [Cytophagaceae bacterium]